MRIRDISMAYDDVGSGVPLLLLHGHNLNRQMWEPQLGPLAAVARVLAPDLRGHGQSEATPEPYSMEQLSDDCVALLDALCVMRPIVVCGLSMGGYVALALYQRHPAQVAGLILCATRASADTPARRPDRDRAAVAVKTHGIAAAVDEMLPQLLAPQTYQAQPALVQWVRRGMEQTSILGSVGATLAMRDRPNLLPLLPQIHKPVLLIHGADDRRTPLAHAEAMRDSLLNARLAVLPDAGHLLNLEQPERFNTLVRSFLKSLGD